ncbi:MAG: sulfatase-like hydrolase/transferase [Planctomycetota bacterium]
MNLLRTVFCSTLALLLACLPTADAEAQAAASSPNVIVIVSDDAGWADYGFMRAADSAADPRNRGAVPTPFLDQLAGNGVVFTNGYTAAVCSPSRAALATGQYGARIGYEQNIPGDTSPIDSGDFVIGLPTEAVTIWERMQSVGYDTAAVGKWHIGAHVNGDGVLGNRPQNQGVEEFRGLIGGSRGYFAGSTSGDQQRLIETISDGQGGVTTNRVTENELNGQHVTDIFGDQSADYIRDKAGSAEPFFLYTSFTAPHTPLQATPEDLAAIDALNDSSFTGNRRTYAAMQYAMDRNVGKMLAALEDPDRDPNTNDGIADNTVIVFINDNGGDCCDSSPNASSNGRLRNGKGSHYEGGIRVPIVVAGAGIAPEARGTVSEDLVHAVDILPTAFAAGGGVLPDNNTTALGDRIDGHDLISRINGEGDGHESLYLRRNAGGQSAVRVGDYKLLGHVGRDFELYDLENDPGESNNLADAMPDKLAELKRVMTDYDVEMIKPRHDSKADDINQSDKFRFRDGAAGGEDVNWSDDGMWLDITEGGQTTLLINDGYANTELTFRNRNGSYTATNDLVRVGNLEFMANAIRLINRGADENQSDGTALINGLPVLLARDHEGNGPELELRASAVDDYRFEIALDIFLYDDLAIIGDGTETFFLSGNLSEYYREGRSVIKTGTSSLELRGTSDLTGRFEVREGQLIAANQDALGDADIVIRHDGQLILMDTAAVAQLIGDTEVDFISDNALLTLNALEGNLPALILNYNGIERVGGLTLDGVSLSAGIYDAESHPGIFGGTGQIQVIPEPTTAGIVILLMTSLSITRPGFRS